MGATTASAFAMSTSPCCCAAAPLPACGPSEALPDAALHCKGAEGAADTDGWLLLAARAGCVGGLTSAGGVVCAVAPDWELVAVWCCCDGCCAAAAAAAAAACC